MFSVIDLSRTSLLPLARQTIKARLNCLASACCRCCVAIVAGAAHAVQTMRGKSGMRMTVRMNDAEHDLASMVTAYPTASAPFNCPRFGTP